MRCVKWICLIQIFDELCRISSINGKITGFIFALRHLVKKIFSEMRKLRPISNFTQLQCPQQVDV